VNAELAKAVRAMNSRCLQPGEWGIRGRRNGRLGLRSALVIRSRTIMLCVPKERDPKGKHIRAFFDSDSPIESAAETVRRKDSDGKRCPTATNKSSENFAS
jgi:hypothetical protein